MNIENEGESNDVVDNKGSNFLSHDVTDNKDTYLCYPTMFMKIKLLTNFYYSLDIHLVCVFSVNGGGTPRV